MALSCKYPRLLLVPYTHFGQVRLICRMMIIDPQVTLTFHGQRHSPMFGESCIHLVVPGINKTAVRIIPGHT